MSSRQNLWVPSPQLSSPILQPWLIFFVRVYRFASPGFPQILPSTVIQDNREFIVFIPWPWYLLRKDLWPMVVCFLSTCFTFIDREHQGLHLLDWFVQKGPLEVSNVKASVRWLCGLCGLCPWLSSTWVLQENLYWREKKFALEQKADLPQTKSLPKWY